MSQADTQALINAVHNLEDTDFDNLQEQLGKAEFVPDQDVIICVSHCAYEA